MKLREILAQEIDCDVLNDYCDIIPPAIVGPVFLTERGKEFFAGILDNRVTFYGKFLEVHIENDKQLELLRDFCYIAAGYCTDKTYNLYIGG